MDLFSPPPLVVYERPSGLADLPPLKRTWPATHWAGDDGRVVTLEIQGNFAAVAFSKGPQPERLRERGEVKGFSPASRLRLFKITNSLDVTRSGPCTFATTTWRDDAKRPTPSAITQARSHCHRSVERLAGRHLAGIWRVEWKVRKSGRHKGEYMPHVHTIYFDIPWVDKRSWTRAWATAIGVNGHVSVKLEKIDSLWKCLNYVSKYIAKVDLSCNLDIPSYLTTHLFGRKWGIYRRELLPRADRVEIRLFPGPLIDEIRAIATAAYAKTPQGDEAGFCVFGPAAAKIFELLDKHLLHESGKNVRS
jgi:hypothetical protein